MCAICGSVGLAPCAKTGADNRQSVARPAVSLAIMGTSFVTAIRPGPASVSDLMQRSVRGSRKLTGADTTNHSFGHAIAAWAIEGETAGERRAELLVQSLAQQKPRAMQPRLNGLRLQAEKISRFLDAHSFDDARYEDGAERIGKFINRLFQHRTNFTLRHALLRIAAGRRGRKVDDFRLVAIGAVGFPIHRRTPASQSSQRLVHGDARDPCA